MFVQCAQVILLCLFCSFSAFAAERETSPDFPLFHSIRPNVKFWIDIYSKYPSNKGVLHDERMLNVIYEVVELVPQDEPDAAELNRAYLRSTRLKYRTILKRLAEGDTMLSKEDRRVAALFGDGSDSLLFIRAAERIRFQMGIADRFGAGITRSGKHLDMVKQTFKRRGLPEDLAYLPHVESSFNTQIVSKAGAAGMWQFMPRTGGRFLRIDNLIDERLDPHEATVAATKLLSYNFNALGTWPLAITAYNHGVGGVRGACRRVDGGYIKIFKKYESRIFRFASRNFYSEFLAARHVAKNARTYFPQLKIESPLERIRIPLNTSSSVHTIAQYYKVELETLRQLNPALKEHFFHTSTSLPEGYYLYFPPKQALMALAKTLVVPDSVRCIEPVPAVEVGETVSMGESQTENQ